MKKTVTFESLKRIINEDAMDNNRSRAESLKLTADYLLGQIRILQTAEEQFRGPPKLTGAGAPVNIIEQRALKKPDQREHEPGQYSQVDQYFVTYPQPPGKG